ncbi:DoxX family protein [Pollutibacter soli]|uniref:DoxX family protein n=1 Tax=Pollutibacter soli TaxID=3034157 RepID=UPI003013DE4D
MSKRNKLIYWIATIWLSLGMATSGIMQVMNHKDEVTLFTDLGYPIYFMTIIGIWKLLGIVAVLIPKYPLLKEWAYAGFFFTMTGAVFSHFAMNDVAKEYFGPILLIVLTIVSWYFRPASRKGIASMS